MADRLSEAISPAVRDPDFRTQLLTKPQQALASMEIHLPPERVVTVVEIAPGQTFVVLPIMTESEVKIVQSGLTLRQKIANYPQGLARCRLQRTAN